MKYRVILSHLGMDGWVKLDSIVEAKTKSKATYKAFKAYVEAYRPTGENLFGLFFEVYFIKN